MKLHDGIQAQQLLKKACELGDGTSCMMAGWMQKKR
jgi:TPR repeat protein